MSQSEILKNETKFIKIGEKVQSKDLINNSLTLEQAKYLIQKSQQIFRSQPTLLNLSAPLKIIGDIYGNYLQLLRLFQICFYSPSSYNIVFLGNYIDKSQHSLQTLFTLLYYKLKYPLTIFMLRGKHQLAENNKIYGLFKQCERKYNVGIWIMVNQMFNYMPLVAVIQKEIFCVSSAISYRIRNLQQICQIQRPLYIKQQQKSTNFIYEILCSKLTNHNNSNMNNIEQSNNNYNNFTEQAVKQWLNNNNLSLIVCSNQILQNGFEFLANNQILTFCSIPNLFGLANLGTIFSIDEDLKCSFIVVKLPTKKVE